MSERSYSEVLASAYLTRSRLIELTHELPKDAPREVLRLWNIADGALRDFLGALEDLWNLEMNPDDGIDR